MSKLVADTHSPYFLRPLQKVVGEDALTPRPTCKTSIQDGIEQSAQDAKDHQVQVITHDAALIIKGTKLDKSKVR